MTRKLVLLVALFAALPVYADGESEAPEAGTSVGSQITGKFVESWNRHDMKALAGIFSEDANFVNVIGMWWKSREEIHKAHESSHRTTFKDSHLSGRAASVELLRPDVLVIHMTWELEGMKGPDGKVMPPRQGIMTLVATREGAEWKVRTAQNTDRLPGGKPRPLAK